MKKLFLFLFALITLSQWIVPTGCESPDSERKTADDNSYKKMLSSFLFVGMKGANPGIYRYVIGTKKYSSVWNSSKGKVIELSTSPSREAVFFITAQKTGKRGIFPFIDNAKLYVINSDSAKPQFVADIGSGLQVFMRWENESSIKVVFNQYDERNAGIIVQHTKIYNTFGKELLYETRAYDLAAEGYPQLPQRKSELISPDNNFSLSFSADYDSSLIILSSIEEEKKYSILRTRQKVNKAEWSADGEYLFISTNYLTPDNRTIFTNQPETSALYVYSLEEKKMIVSWDGSGAKSFFITGDLLIFDDGFEKSSSIKIYNFKSLRKIDEVKIPGGCGLNAIPTLLK